MTSTSAVSQTQWKCESLRNASRTLFRAKEVYARHYNGVVQGLLRLRSVKSEEFPGCGGGTEAAGDDGTSHEICKQIANSQTAHGHGRPCAHVDRTHRVNHLRPVCQELGIHLVNVRDLKI